MDFGNSLLEHLRIESGEMNYLTEALRDGIAASLVVSPAQAPTDSWSSDPAVFDILFLCNSMVPGRHSRRGGPKCRRPECLAELHCFGVD